MYIIGFVDDLVVLVKSRSAVKKEAIIHLMRVASATGTSINQVNENTCILSQKMTFGSGNYLQAGQEIVLSRIPGD